MLQLQDHYKLSCTSKRSGNRLFVTIHVNDLRTGESQIQILEFTLSQIGKLTKEELKRLNSTKAKAESGKEVEFVDEEDAK